MNIVVIDGTVESRSGMEPRYMDDGRPYVHFTLVHVRSFQTFDGTPGTSRAYIRCRAYGKTAEDVTRCAGKKVLVYGRLGVEKVDDSYRLVVTARALFRIEEPEDEAEGEAEAEYDDVFSE